MDLQRPIEELAGELKAMLGPAAVRREEPLAAYTVWRIGGPAEVLAVVQSADALRAAVSLAWERGIACRVLGGGSNVLVSDAGVRGLVVINRAGAVRFDGALLRAESGAALSALARRCADRGLAGLEWAAGIPGTVGGAVVGNAGASGGDMAGVLSRASVLEPGGQVAEWTVQRLEYGYRSSALKRAGTGGGERQPVVLEAEFSLAAGERDALRARISELAARRRASQPPGASCGSVFKNPPGDYAGRLIEAAGLKGRQSGGAQISPVHANFIVNAGGATSADVAALVAAARECVEERFGVRLELEIELVGEWSQNFNVYR